MPSIFPSFRSSVRKSTKPRTMRDDLGWYHYRCGKCGKDMLFRKRQRHADLVRCASCLTAPTTVDE